MEWPVFTHFQRTFLGIIGLGILGIALTQTSTVKGFFGLGVGGVCLMLAVASESDMPYEPPFLKIKYHQWRIRFIERLIQPPKPRDEEAIAEWKLEIAKRQSRIAELERFKQ